MITKAKFEVYEKVRSSGETNMFAIKRVIELSLGELTREDCIEIMENYDNLVSRYPGVRRD